MNSIAIKYIGELAYDAPGGTLLLRTEQEYVSICKKILESSSAGSILNVWVKKKAHYIWLKSFLKLVDINAEFQEMTPRTILKTAWGVIIPDWLDDGTVISQQLLNIELPSEHPATFVDTMLGMFLGPELQAETLKEGKLSEVIQTANNPEGVDQVERYPVLSRCLEEKYDSWSVAAGSGWIEEVSSGLKDNPETIWKELTLKSILGNYPEKLLEFVVPPHRITFVNKVPGNALANLPFHSLAREQAIDQIEIFFHDISPTVKSADEFRRVIKCVSGRLPKEFKYIEDILNSGGFDVTAQEIDLVRDIFEGCPGITTVQLSGLDRFILPMRPALPGDGEKWETERWIKWAVEEYVPFRRWQMNNDVYDPEVEGAVRAFSNWYIEEYGAIHQDAGKSLVHLLSDWRESISTDQLSLVLLVDCMPVEFWGLLQKAFAGVGLHRHRLEYRFAPLPTTTEISKPLLLSGKWDRRHSDYAAILKEKNSDGKEYVYLPDLKALEAVKLSENPNVFVLNYLPADETLHSDVEAKGSSYDEELYRLFSRLADSVKRLLERWPGEAETFSLYVLTDHGATRILAEEKSDFDSSIVNKLFMDQKRRYAPVVPTEAAGVPDNLWEFGYRFKQVFSSDETEYFIPRGHNNVARDNRYVGYVHGGATPEEVIVPAAIFKPVKADWHSPALRFINIRTDPATGMAVFYIQRVIPLRIEIQNPNSVGIRITKIEVLSPDTDVKEVTLTGIKPHSEGEVEIDCYFNNSAREQDELIVKLFFEIAGEEYSKEIMTGAEFRTATRGGFNLKDLQ